MNKFISPLLALLLIVSFSHCKEDDIEPVEEELYGYFTFYGLDVASNPSNYTKSDILSSPDNYWAEIKDVYGTPQLKIYYGDQYNNGVTTVDYTGVGNYSSDDTNLNCQNNSYNGFDNPSYSIDRRVQGTGGYMEILTHENGIITGNLRYINCRWVQESGSYKYTGIDDCNFEIKLNP